MLKKARLKSKKQLTHDVIELVFDKIDDFNFQAGQFITIKVNDGEMPPCFRAYSIASAPENKDVDLCIKVVVGGRGTNWLNKLQENDEIEFLGPSGHFTFKNSEKKALFIATGTGLAPFRSMVEDQITQGSAQKMHILFGVRHEKDIFYQEIFDKMAAENENVEFQLTLSRPETPDWQGSTGRVTKILEEMQLDPQNTEVYICGLKDMIDSVTNLLKEKGFDEEIINFEKYD